MLRAGPFSDERIIRLANRRFVPVFFDLQDGSPAGDPDARRFLVAARPVFGRGSVPTPPVLLMNAAGAVLGEVSNYASADEVLEAMRKVLEEHPDFNQPTEVETALVDPVERAELLIDLQEPDRARLALEGSDAPRAQYLLGRLDRFAGDWVAMRGHFDQVKDPDLLDDIRMESAYPLWEAGLHRELMEHLAGFPVGSNRHSEAVYYRGLARFHLGERDAAVEEWRGLVTRCSQDPWIYRADWAYTECKQGNRQGSFSSADLAQLDVSIRDARTGAVVDIDPEAEVVWATGPGLIRAGALGNQTGFGNTVSAKQRQLGQFAELITGDHRSKQTDGRTFVAVFIGNNRAIRDDITFTLPPEFYAAEGVFAAGKPLLVQFENPLIAGNVDVDTPIALPQLGGMDETFVANVSSPVHVYGEPNEQVTLHIENNRMPVLRYDMNDVFGEEIGGQTYQTVRDLAGSHTGFLDGPTLDSSRALAGNSLDFTDVSHTVTTADSADLRFADSFRFEIVVGSAASSPRPASLLSKGGDYQVFLDGSGRATVLVQTTSGPCSATTQDVLLGARDGFDTLIAELKAGQLSITLNGDFSRTVTAPCPGTLLTSSNNLVIGGGFVGQIDIVTVSAGFQPMLTSFPNGQESLDVTLDASGHAVSQVFSLGNMASEDDMNVAI